MPNDDSQRRKHILGSAVNFTYGKEKNDSRSSSKSDGRGS